MQPRRWFRRDPDRSTVALTGDLVAPLRPPRSKPRRRAVRSLAAALAAGLVVSLSVAPTRAEASDPVYQCTVYSTSAHIGRSHYHSTWGLGNVYYRATLTSGESSYCNATQYTTASITMQVRAHYVGDGLRIDYIWIKYERGSKRWGNSQFNLYYDRSNRNGSWNDYGARMPDWMERAALRHRTTTWSAGMPRTGSFRSARCTRPATSSHSPICGRRTTRPASTRAARPATSTCSSTSPDRRHLSAGGEPPAGNAMSGAARSA